MVHITIAGGTGSVAREVIDALIASGNHEITILTRKIPAPNPTFPADVLWKAVDYCNLDSLTTTLQGTHTLLSFIQLLSPDGEAAQKNLIDAAVRAGVKRFAPSEWASKDLTDMPFYASKQSHRTQLASLPPSASMEWTLFQPGLFLEYLAYPHKTAEHLDPMMTVFDFAHSRAMVVEGMEDEGYIALTSVKDLARAVVRMVELPHKSDEEVGDGRKSKKAVLWPKVSGTTGNKYSVRQIIELGGRITGKPWEVTKLKQADLEAGDLQCSWGLRAVHSAVPPEIAGSMLKQVAIGMLLSFSKGAWNTTDEVNCLLDQGDFEWTKAEEFLGSIWCL